MSNQMPKEEAIQKWLEIEQNREAYPFRTWSRGELEIYIPVLF